MNPEIAEHVAAYNIANGYSTDKESLIETIRNGDKVWRGKESPGRRWVSCFTVVNVGGMLIGFRDAFTDSGDPPRDKGWEFEPSTICEVVAKQVTTTVYEPKPIAQGKVSFDGGETWMNANVIGIDFN